jgi:serine protease Do
MITEAYKAVPRPRRRRFAALSVVLVLSVAVFPIPGRCAVTGGADEQSIATLRQMGKAFASIAEKASLAVVGVRATKTLSASSRDESYGDSLSPFDEEFFRYFFGPNTSPRRSPRSRGERDQPRQVAQGSGFIIAPDGYILTNNHLVGEADTVSVQLDDGRKLTAKIVGADDHTDVALIKIEATDLPYIELADSSKLEVGEWVIAIGNPFGLSHTVTAGIVSAKGRSQIGVADYEDLIQTDAAINFGNSGGPLLNLDGKAVGMNAAIIGPGGNVGIGLAIPSNMARDVYQQLKESGKVVRGFLGVSLQDLESGMGDYFGVANGKGVVIVSVVEGSAAEKAGVKADDVVVEFEGQPVTNMNDFRNRVAMHKPGTKVELVVIRENKRKTLTAVLDELPKDDTTIAGGGRGDFQNQLGLSVQTLTEEMAERLGYDTTTGVVVTDVNPGSLAAEAGIRAGTLILEVNRTPVRNVKQFAEAINEAKSDGKALLRVQDEDWVKLVVLPFSNK